MKKFPLLYLVVLAGFLALSDASICAQDSDRLPIDSHVTVKRLTNGLTYYIRRNPKPENRAQFHLAINAGSILEKPSQQGLAHFLEHMAFNGTKNFEKHELVNFLERIGMRFGADLNAYTSFDETVYRLEVPMDDPAVVKKAFQVLEDWAHQISFDAAEIEKERGVVIEEWRTRRGAQGRLQDRQIPVLFHDSLYADRLPIGKTNIIQSVDRDTFLDFYRNWYRPDLMAVVAVGDFDPKKIEELVIEHFSNLKNPAEPLKRLTPVVPDHAETLFSIETDPELSYTSIQIACKHPVEPDGSAADYRRDLVHSLYSTMLNRRLSERSQEADPPYLFASVGKSHMVRVKDMASQRALVKEGRFAEGLKTLLLESRRARRDGFTPAELERAKVGFLRQLEAAFEEREKTESGSYAEEYVRNFLEGEAIPGIEEELKLTRRFFSDITIEEVNRAADRWITESNRVILFSAPDKPGLKAPTQQEILEVIKEASGADIAAYDDGDSSAPLLPKMPVAGKITSEKQYPEVELTEWTLSNHARVLLKPTPFKNDQIMLSGFSPGGHSLVADKDYLSGSMSDGIIRQSGVGAYDLIQLRKKLAGKLAGVSTSVDELYEEVSGSASPKDLETLFQLLHLYFTAPRSDEKSFQSLVARMKVGLANRERNPDVVFGDAIEKALYGDHSRHRPMTIELLKELDRETALRIYRERFADASDFTFVFVGSFKPEELRPLVETYIASLPDLERKEAGRDVGDEPKPGQLNVEVKKGLEAKASVQLMFHGDAEWSMKERLSLRGAVEVLRIRLREVLREDKGGVYGVNVSGDMAREPKQTFACEISFTCSPESAQDLIQAALDEVKRLQQDGPSKENLDKVIETQLRNHELGMKENGFWLGSIVFYLRNNLPLPGILEAPERIKGLTADRVRDAARKYFSSDNLLIARLLPEAKPAAKAE